MGNKFRNQNAQQSGEGTSTPSGRTPDYLKGGPLRDGGASDKGRKRPPIDKGTK